MGKMKIRGWVAKPKEYHYDRHILNLFIDKPEWDTVNGLWTGDYFIGNIKDDVAPNLKYTDEPILVEFVFDSDSIKRIYVS